MLMNHMKSIKILREIKHEESFVFEEMSMLMDEHMWDSIFESFALKVVTRVDLPDLIMEVT